MLKIPTPEQIVNLPRWGAVAFAARCAEFARQQLADKSFPLHDLMALAENRAIAEKIAANPPTGENKAGTRPSAEYWIQELKSGIWTVSRIAPRGPVDKATIRSTQAALETAIAACAAVIKDHEQVAQFKNSVFVAFEEALAALGGTKAAKRALAENFERLARYANAVGANERTAFPSDLFDTVEPVIKIEPVTKQPEILSVELLVDPGSAPPEVIADILSDLSMLYRKTGGSGITFTPDSITVLETA
jgi:hypothetical protein